MLDENTRQRIDAAIRSGRVVLFMKGTRQFPQCGFSGRVVQLLDASAVPYETVNILEDPALRAGLKEYSDWPTFPQLYIDGKLIGGCDIVTEMHQSGELQKLLAD